jgi:ferredoxin
VIKKGIFSSVYCQVDTELCVGCGTCVSHCITNAVSLD